MSTPPYTANVNQNGDLNSIIDANGEPTAFDDATFQTWLSQQSTQIQQQFQLSNEQQAIRALRANTVDYPTWQANVTPAQKDRILFVLTKRLLQTLP